LGIDKLYRYNYTESVYSTRGLNVWEVKLEIITSLQQTF